MTTTALGVSGHWLSVRDGDDRARALQRRHYSHLKYVARHHPNGRAIAHPNQRRFVGSGEHVVLLTLTCDAVFSWRLQRFRHDQETGIECTLFRNEGPVLSSDLIREADAIAWQRWPGERLFTFVDPAEIRSSNPGFCFLMAGWTRLKRRTQGGLVILERTPA